MLILILYWVVTMISGVDFDVDIDVDVDIDIDADIDTNIEGGNIDFQDISSTEVNKDDVVKTRKKPLKWWQVVLIFFNFNELRWYLGYHLNTFILLLGFFLFWITEHFLNTSLSLSEHFLNNC